MEVSKSYLTEKQIEVGLQVHGDEDFLYLIDAKRDKLLAYFNNNADETFIQNMAQQYLFRLKIREN
jgi:hypothetical protein